ncbi:MAG: glycoside hydrolase family 9 protein [Balneolaceae bacterium]
MKFIWIIVYFFLLWSCETSTSSFISVNLVGYNADYPKQAFLVNAKANTFEIVNSENNEVVYENGIAPLKQPDEATGDSISVIEFTDFSTPGSYFIRVKDSPQIHSLTFKIDDDVYKNVTNTILQSYYYHRCGTKVDNGEEWSYEVCHLDDAPFYGHPEISGDFTGGWHDAGDYNKFSINTALSAGLLLYLYELDSGTFQDGDLNIPEKNNGTPDLLDETRWALEWLLKMQRQDGAIFHKISQKKWTGEYLPHQDPEIRYVFDVSSRATAGFAAVASLGARFFKHYDREFSSKLFSAALKAWEYLEENPEQIPRNGFKNPPDVRGGEYSDPDDRDERLWASIELYKLTRHQKFLDYFVDTYREMRSGDLPVLSWKNFHSLAFSSFLNNTSEQHLSLKREISTLYLTNADYLLEIQQANNYLNLLSINEYYWGSNSVGLAYAFDLIQAYKITNMGKYYDAALHQYHYVLGRNPFNMSQVTAVGSRFSEKPYHQLSEMGDFGKPIPGMLVGGPNNHLHLNDEVISPFPGKNYEDRFKNYLVNETAINYTAILAYVSGYFSFDSDTIVSGD